MFGQLTLAMQGPEIIILKFYFPIQSSTFAKNGAAGAGYQPRPIGITFF